MGVEIEASRDAPGGKDRSAWPVAAPPLPAPARAALTAALTLRDTVQARAQRLLPPANGFPDGALDAAVHWLGLTHEATGRRGSSKGFSLIRGWLPAYPETTGYVLGTVLEYAARAGDESWVPRAVEMGDWEISEQRSDGGVLEGVGTEDRSIVFNTGMVLHGYVDLYTRGHGERFLEAARRAGNFLVANLRDDGTWRPEVEYSRMPHAYNSRVSWAMLRLSDATGERRFASAARRQLDWVTERQRENGWFDSCIFKRGGTPSTHGIAYTIRGLLESHCLTGEPAYLDAAVQTAEALMRKLEVHGYLPASYDSSWRATASHECVTGTAQMGGVWLRLYQITGDARHLNSGLKAVEQAARRQQRGGVAALHGAIPGSFPVYGRYAPLQYPNWATKFLADSLMLRQDCLAAA